MSEMIFDLQRFSVINNKSDNTLVSGTSDDDKITNGGNDSIVNKEYADNLSISGGAGKDTIRNNGEYSSNTTITGDAGNDFILNNSTDVTISGGAGNDNITNNGSYVSVSAGDGKDSIVNKGSNVTISGGAGNDTIKSTGENVLFVYSGGNDKIYGFNATSSLQIGDGDATYTEKISGNNIIITVGKDKITLEGAADKAVNIAGTALYNGHKYRVFNDNMNWEEAKAYCESLGGHLAVITSAGEQDFVYSLAKQGRLQRRQRHVAMGDQRNFQLL